MTEQDIKFNEELGELLDAFMALTAQLTAKLREGIGAGVDALEQPSEHVN